MSPIYNMPEEDDLSDDEVDIDISDLKEQYDVRLEAGLDTFILIDGLPRVPEENKDKLVKFVLRKLATAGTIVNFTMNLAADNLTAGYAFVEFSNAKEASKAVKTLHGTQLDRRHTMLVNKLTDIERYGREGRVQEEYTPPQVEEFAPRGHLRSWLGDVNARDQLIMYRKDDVGLYYHDKENEPELLFNRKHWTEGFVQWSPQGTYMLSIHQQGAQLWGGPEMSREQRFAHPGVNLVHFSPLENYLVTWSHRPISVDENNPGPLSMEEDGKNNIVWNIKTGQPLRSFTTLDLPGPAVDSEGNPVKKKIQWPAFKWSADENYVARMDPGKCIYVYELPSMKLLDKSTVKIDGVQDFEWAPTTPKLEGKESSPQLFCFWTPEMGSSPARVGLMSMPDRQIVRTLNLFNVSDAKLHWHEDAKYLCVKVDRHSKSKKSLATSLEVFRIQEKGIPVEVVEGLKDTVINFAWEPKGDRFVLITAGEVPANAAVPPKTSVHFFCPEKSKGTVAGNFRLVRTIEKKNSNGIYWAPKGRFVVVATINSQQSFDLDFWDVDFEGEKDDRDKDVSANVQLMATAEHYGITDVHWDPTGRYVATVSSAWRHTAENGYHIYDFKGTLLREEAIDGFKQIEWRPRPPTLLSKDEQKTVRKNLRDYTQRFTEEDLAKRDAGNRAVVEERRDKLLAWHQWHDEVVQRIVEQFGSLGCEGDGDEAEGGAEVVEEIVEEIVDETEEVIG